MMDIATEQAARRSSHARAMALRNAAFRDSRALGRLGHQGLLDRFYREIDERLPGLSARERDDRAQLLLSSHMTELRAKRTAKSIRRKAAAAEAAAAN